MLILTCPYCHARADETELTPGGEAHLRRVGPEGSDEEFAAYLFDRANPKGPHFERWRHSAGCGKWFLCARDTATLRVYGTYSAQTTAPPAEIIAAIRAVHPEWSPPEGFAAPAQDPAQDEVRP